MIDMMFVVALSGMRASGEAGAAAEAAPADVNRDPPYENISGGPLRKWHPNVSFDTEATESPIFFRKDVNGRGKLRLAPRWAEDGLPYAL